VPLYMMLFLVALGKLPLTMANESPEHWR
jgi:hypothetical protein